MVVDGEPHRSRGGMESSAPSGAEPVDVDACGPQQQLGHMGAPMTPHTRPTLGSPAQL